MKLNYMIGYMNEFFKRVMIDFFKYIELLMWERNLCFFNGATDIISNNCGYK